MIRRPTGYRALQGILLFVALMFSSAIAHAEDEYIAVHPIYCASEKDIIELADASSSGYGLRRLVAQKVKAGQCSPPATANKKAGLLITRFTPKRVPYFCFREEVEAGQFADKYTCVLSRFISTVREEVMRRSGNYKTSRRMGDYLKVQCLEGGSVTIEQRGDELYRISDALQLTIKVPEVKPTPAGSNLDRAIREGCKGVDYLIATQPTAAK